MKVPRIGAKPAALVPPKAQKATTYLEKVASASGPAHAAEKLKAVADLQHAASSAAAQQLVGRLQTSALAKPGPAQILAGYLNGRLAAGETPDDFVAALKERADHEAKRLQQLLTLGGELARTFHDRARVRSFIDDVIMPMHRNQISGPTIRARTNDVFGMDVLSAAQAKSGPLGGRLTVAIGIGASLGCLVGGEKSFGVALNGFSSTLRVFKVWGRSVQIGTVEASVAGQVEFSLGVPNPKTPDFLDGSPFTKGQGWGGWALGWAGGGGWKVTVGGAISLTPDFLKPVEQWEFNSVSVQVGGGGGADCGMFLQGSVMEEVVHLPGRS